MKSMIEEYGTLILEIILGGAILSLMLLCWNSIGVLANAVFNIFAGGN